VGYPVGLLFRYDEEQPAASLTLLAVRGSATDKALVWRYENELTYSATAAGWRGSHRIRARLQPCREKHVQQQGFSP
jgi:hypothetical protein